jgi:hypothetical protein
MASGIYLIGQRAEVEPIFDNHILPQLSQRGLIVLDRSLVPIEDSNKGLLLSLSGVSLGEMLSQGIVSAFESAKALGKTDVGMNWEYSFGLVKIKYVPGSSPLDKKGNLDENPKEIWSAVYKTISSYADSDAASKEFPLRVQEYLLERLNVLSEQVSGEISELLDRRLSDFT